MNREEIRSTVRGNQRLVIGSRGSTTVSDPALEAGVQLNFNSRAQQFILVWLDSTIDKTDAGYHDLLAHIEKLGINYTIFTDIDQCIQSLIQRINEKVILVVNGFTGEYVVNNVHDLTHMHLIYVFCTNVRRQQIWTKRWSKIKGLFTDIDSICGLIKQNIELEQNSLVMSARPVNEKYELALGFLGIDDDVRSKNLDELDPSFMFTQVLKEILLELEYNDMSMQDLVTLCREKYHGNKEELANIDSFEKEYYSRTPIWWYTRECFAYHMLNSALRTLDANTIIKMGFFLRDLHLQIVELYKGQFVDKKYSHSFIVYRGQALTIKDFEMLKTSVGGLMSFNSFLSTSMDENTALQFMYNGCKIPGRVGILFAINTDVSHSLTEYADVQGVSCYTKESEILFSMHSVFRIQSIQKTHENIYQVNLTSTNDGDQQLRDLSNCLREETKGSSGWDRIGKLLIKLGIFNSAQQTYESLLTQTTNDIELAHFYHQLGYIKEDLGEYDDALSFYEKSLDIKQKDPPSDKSDFAMYYNNCGTVYDKKGDYSTAAAFFLKAIDIFQQILHSNDLRLATCYNNIGSVYYNLGEYSKVLAYYDKALTIDLEGLPENDPALGIDYNNIGLVYHDMQEYDTALSYFKKALAIYNKSLQSDHPRYSSIYNNIGSVYTSQEEYPHALSYYEKALEIDKKTLPKNHPYLGVSYNNMGSVYKNMKEYSNALSMFEYALNIEKSAQSPNEARIEQYTKNIALVKDMLNL